jgi:hypothetical protein
MTPDELPADMEGRLQWALLSFGTGQGHIAVSAPDLRALLKAYQEQRRALERIEQGLPEIRAVHRFSEARLIARAALTGEDTATLSLSGETQTDARTRGDG